MPVTLSRHKQWQGVGVRGGHSHDEDRGPFGPDRLLGLHAVVTAVTLYPEAPFADTCDGSNWEKDFP
jgi:hypothetical protein